MAKPFVLRTILVIEPDDEVRPLIRHNLIHQGYRVIIVLDAADAIARLRDGYDRPDLILLNQMGQSLEAWVESGRQIRDSAALPIQTPVVVMAECYGVELEGSSVQVGNSEYVTYLEDGQQLMNLLSRLFDNLQDAQQQRV